LHEGDLVGFLRSRPAASADLVVAADVFVYVADLAGVFAETRRVLERGGLFAFTVQAHAGAGVVLGEDARYAHGEPLLRDLADAAGLAVVLFERVSTREDRGEPVPGFLVVAERG
ncbi:MAG TPA: methyltransferase domain-containing protein, partial [Microvirga sp.]|nr:methyltransferase domain-containing protein [Microvirga sp.]